MKDCPDCSPPKTTRYMITFEHTNGSRLPIVMEGKSLDDALWAIVQSRPYLDVRDYPRYTWIELPYYDERD